MVDWNQAWQEIAARPEGPLAMRFYLQPCMSTLFAIRDGLKDARIGRPAYFWAIFTDQRNRNERLRDGWRSIGKIFFLAAVLDVLYQLIVLQGLRPLETLIVSTLLAIVPYITVRGLVTRLANLTGTGSLARDERGNPRH
jgi:hypothetical protein